MSMQQYCLRWNNHQPNFISVFSSLLNNESLVDVTLATEGRHLQAHKVVLSACSSYFQSLFTINPCQHPIVILKDVKFSDLKVMVDFMYYGEVNVSQEQLPHILKTAEMLKIKGLAEIPVDQSALTKSHSNSTERAELLTPGESNWGSEDIQRLSPSPCPLSPASRRKRLRKTSTGSGSGSTERTSEDHTTNEITMTSPMANAIGTVIKPDPGGFTSDCSQGMRSKQHSTDSEPRHETIEEPPHQITLQVPQQDISHNLDHSSSLDMAGQSTISQQTTTTGYQWGIVDGSFPRFALTSCHSNITVPPDLNYTASSTVIEDNTSPLAESSTSTINHNHLSASPSPSPQIIQKRKRSVNPQADENFVRALEAVRFGGIGFCKAAKMYGVNNRTLWLEYKKRGYPNNRISIKNRKQEFVTPNAGHNQDPTSPITAASMSDQENEIGSPTNHLGNAIISGTFLESRHVDLSPILQRPRYLDAVGISAQHLGLPGVSFEQM